MASGPSRLRLTKTSIDSLPVPSRAQGTRIHRDSELRGFGLLITPNGARSFVVERRVNGRNRRVTIGPYGVLTVQQARRRAQAMLAAMASGIDPVTQKRRDRCLSVTLREAFDTFLEQRKALSSRTRRDYQRHLRTSFQDWADRPLGDITADDVSARHLALGQRSQAQADLAMRYLSAVFNFAASHFELPNGESAFSKNPVRRLTKTRAWYGTRRRQTYIKSADFPAFWKALNSLSSLRHPKPTETARDYLVFLLFTGLRRSEAAGLKWSDVDLRERSIRILDTKNHRPHVLPLPQILTTLLQRRWAQRTSEFVFPNSSGSGGITEVRHHLEKIEKQSGVRFCCHDLRRTFATVADSIDISQYAVKRLLNHKSGGDVTAGYIAFADDRLRDAMNKIATRLIALATASEAASIRDAA